MNAGQNNVSLCIIMAQQSSARHLTCSTNHASKLSNTCTSTSVGRPSLQTNFITTKGEHKMQKQSNNPIQQVCLATAQRCLAKTRQGAECQSPAVKGKRRCRMHGGTNPGAPQGNQNARKHGGYSAKTKEAVRFLKTIAKIVRETED